MSRRRPVGAAEVLVEPGARLAPPTEIAEAIAHAAASLGVGPGPSARRSGWPAGTSYVWRFSALPWSRQVTDRRERP